jgi:hypothetical protein
VATSGKGFWGYAPLILSLASTREVLYLVNRPGNVVSHEGCVPGSIGRSNCWGPHADEITLRGDTDFTLGAELDRWDNPGIKFLTAAEGANRAVRRSASDQCF